MMFQWLFGVPKLTPPDEGWRPISTFPREVGAKFIAGNPFADEATTNWLVCSRSRTVTVELDPDDDCLMLSGSDPSMFSHWKPLKKETGQ